MANMSLVQVLDHLDHLGKGSMEILLKVLKGDSNLCFYLVICQ